MDFIWFLIIGAVAGWLAGRIMKGEGFGLVEILSTCPTNWKMDASACMEKIKSEIIPSFPLGIFTDKLKENA